MPCAVLFDLDDTLFDHRHGSQSALARVHEAFADRIALHDLLRHHARFLEALHLEVLAGRIGLDDARRERFRRVFEALGIQLSPEQSNRVASAYREGYIAAWRTVDGAAELLQVVRRTARVGIVTNNLLEEQVEKLRACALEPLVDALVVSEEAGFTKPDPRIFEVALRRLGVDASSAVMVGDSWSADVEGARAAGIFPVWFNPRRAPLPAGGPVVAQIASLRPADDVARLLMAHMPDPHARRD